MLPSLCSPRPLARSGSRLPARSGWPRAGARWRLAAVAGALATGLAIMVAQAPSAPAAPGTLAASATPAPHQDKLSYLGVSWGTALGAVYRSLFPATVGRMWLDSVVGPVDTIGAYIAARIAAVQRDFGRFAAWVAARNSSYGSGTTAAQVSAALLAMTRALDAEPVTFTDISQPIDGSLVALLSSESSPLWPGIAEVLKELRGATSGTTAPPAVKQLFTTQPAPAGVPEQDNRTAGLALTCNALPASFAAYWQAHRLTLARNPLLDGRAAFGAQCAGWPLPVRPWPLRHTAAPLEMSGHIWESTTPYLWARQMQSVIGGNLFTVNDDVHADAPAAPDCAAHIVGYLDTGRPDTGQCTGSPVPTSPAPRWKTR